MKSNVLFLTLISASPLWAANQTPMTVEVDTKTQAAEIAANSSMSAEEVCAELDDLPEVVAYVFTPQNKSASSSPVNEESVDPTFDVRLNEYIAKTLAEEHEENLARAHKWFAIKTQALRAEERLRATIAAAQIASQTASTPVKVLRPEDLKDVKLIILPAEDFELLKKLTFEEYSAWVHGRFLPPNPSK